MTSPVLRPLSLGEILDVSFGVYRRLFAPLLVVTAVTRVVPLILSVYLQGLGGALVMFDHPWLTLSLAVLSLITNAIAAAASTFIVSESYLGRRITAGDSFRRAVPFIGRLIAVAMVTALVVGLGLILFLVPGLILIAGLVLASPALVIEDLGHATDALGRSWALSRGHRWRIFGALLVTVILIQIPSMALGGLAAVGSTDPETLRTGLSATGLLLLSLASGLQLLIYPMIYCVLTVAYYDLRVRKEALDLEVLAAGLSRA